MQITLADAVSLKSTIGKRIQELLQERNSVSTVTVKKDAEYDKPERTVEEVTAELEEARADILELTLILSKSNLENTVDWDGKKIPLTVALELAKQKRGEVNSLKSFAKRKKEEIQSSSWGSEDKYVIAMYDPKEYKDKALKLERQVNKLSSDINNKNYNTFVEFPSASKYFS